MQKNQQQDHGPQEVMPLAPFFKLNPQGNAPDTQKDISQEEEERHFRRPDEPINPKSDQQRPA